MLDFQSLRQHNRWSTYQWQRFWICAFIALCVASLIPAIKKPGTARLLAYDYIPNANFQRKALNFRKYVWYTETVGEGETLGDLFKRRALTQQTMHVVLSNASAKQAFSRIHSGDQIEFEHNGYHQLRGMRFDKSEIEQVTLVIDGENIQENILKRKLETRVLAASGVIHNSLSADAQKAGLSATIVNQMADVFKYDIDFVEDVREGDQFHVVYEQSFLEGKPFRQSHVRAARFTNRGETFSAYRYTYKGKEQYFNAEGRPLKKVLLRIPIEFARLSSTFGMRKHPVLGRMRAHKGVDYAARTGTPIMAAGDGRIEFSGWKNGYGRVIIINHGQSRSTLYGHMSAFGKYSRGQFVSQGAIIGRVGSTGLASGPHLHYEFRINGTQVNPLKVTMPKPEPLRGAELAHFKNAIAPAVAMMEQSATTAR